MSSLLALDREFACCRVAGRAYGAGRRAIAACRGEGSIAEVRAGHGEERTWNIWYMFVTLDVSKLSGWLNADARCGESNGGQTVRGEVWGGGRAAGEVRRKQRAGERARLQIGGRARGGAHPEHVGHARDAGGVEAQRLVER
eukprot:scaffold32020_cov57-Phaeocystis_antarctica.AAC.1